MEKNVWQKAHHGISAGHQSIYISVMFSYNSINNMTNTKNNTNTLNNANKIKNRNNAKNTNNIKNKKYKE